MKKVTLLLLILIVIFAQCLHAQKIFYNIDLGPRAGIITSMVQDQLGNIWLTASDRGLLKYDGSKITAYVHSDKDTNSIAGAHGFLETLAVDSAGRIWIGSNGDGMDMFDPTTNIFK